MKTDASPVAAPRPLRIRTHELVRDTIWNTAIDLFRKKGFDETTVDEIAAAAGTSKRTFFRYFESKGDVIARAVTDFGPWMQAAVQACPPSWSTAQVFREAVRSFVREAASVDRTRDVMTIASKSPAARAAMGSRQFEVELEIAKAFASHASVPSELHASILAGLAQATIGIVMWQWFERGTDSETITQEVFSAMDGMVHGAAGRRAPSIHKSQRARRSKRPAQTRK